MRPQHLGAALVYASSSVDLTRPVIVGFNATETPTAQEFPLWQAAVGLLFKAVRSTWYGWATVVSLLVFFSCLWPFLSLARDYVGERPAQWALAFFLAQPLVVQVAGEAATDGLCLALMIWFLFAAHKMLTGSPLWWIPATIFGSLTAVSKLPFYMVAGLCSIAMLFFANPRKPHLWVLLCGSGLVAAGLFAAWSGHTSALAADAVYPFTELRLSHSAWLNYWFFGDLDQRLNPVSWVRAAWRFLHGTLGGLPLVALLIGGLFYPESRLPRVWLAAMLAVTLIFANLVFAHWHYYLMCSPAVALLCGIALAKWEPFWEAEMPLRMVRFGLVLAVLSLSAVQGLATMRTTAMPDPFYERISRVIQEHTGPADKLLVHNYHLIWGGEVLFRSGRKGLCVPALRGSPLAPTPKGLCDLLGTPADLERLKQLGYNKVVLISQSPLQFAAIAINGNQHERGLYPAHLFPAFENWRTVYRSEDIMIKEIP